MSLLKVNILLRIKTNMFGDQKMKEDKVLIKASGHGELSAKGSSADTGNGATESQSNEKIHNNNTEENANNGKQGSEGNASGSGGNGNDGGDHRDSKKKDEEEEDDSGGSHEQDPPGSSNSSTNSLGVSTMPVEGETSTVDADQSKTETSITEESHQQVEKVPPLDEKFAQQKDTPVEESLEEISLTTSKNQDVYPEKIENVQPGVILKSEYSSQKSIFGAEETEEYVWNSPQDPACILQLSKDASLVTESVDDEGMYIIPPSPEAYGPTPIMFPSTPSLEEYVAETEADYYDTKDTKQTEEPRISLSLAKVRKCGNKDVQQQHSETISHSSNISTKRTPERKDLICGESEKTGSEEKLDSLSVCRKITFSQDDSSQENTPEKVRDLLATQKSRLQSFYKDSETSHQEVKEVFQESATTAFVPHSHVSTPESSYSGGRAYRMLSKREKVVSDSPKKSPKMSEKRHAQASSPILTTKHRKHFEVEQYSISDVEMAQEEKVESQGEMEEEWHLHLSASENTQSFAFSSQEESHEDISTGSLDKISTSIQKEHQTGSSVCLTKQTGKTSPVVVETEPVSLPLKDDEKDKVVLQQTESSRLSQENKVVTPVSQISDPTVRIEEMSTCSDVLPPRTETFQSRPQFSFEIPARLKDAEKEQLDKQLSPQKPTIFTKIKELKTAVVEDTHPPAGSEGDLFFSSWLSQPHGKDEDAEVHSAPNISQDDDSVETQPLSEGALAVCYKPMKDPKFELSEEMEKREDSQLTHFRQVKGRRSPVVSQTEEDQEVTRDEQTVKGDISVSYEMKDRMSSRGDKEKGKKVLKRPTQKHQHIEVGDVEPVAKQKKQAPEQEKVSSQLPNRQPQTGETERSVLSPSLSTQEKGVQVEITSSEPVSQVSDSPRRIETTAVQDLATKDKEKSHETSKKEESTSFLIRVTVRKIVTKEFMYNGKVVKKTVDEEEEEPVVQEIPEEHISPTGSTSSSSRVTCVSHRSSITSGELGDISSLGTTTSSGVTSSLASSSTSRSSEHTTASQRSPLSKTSSTSSLDKVSLIRTRSSDPGNIPHSQQDPDTSQEDMFLRPQFALSRRPAQDKSGGHQEHSDISDLSLPLAESTRVTRSLAISDFSTGHSQSLADSDKGTFPQTPKQRKIARGRKDTGKKQEKLTETSFKGQKSEEDLQSIEEPGHKSSETSGSSPEIPLVCLVRTKEVQEKSTTEESVQSFGVLPGKRVMARWRDGYYYPGTVKKTESNGRWTVQFDDGDNRAIRESDLLVIALLHEGLSVLALSEDDYYDPGIIRGHYREGTEVGYVVERDDRVTKRFSNSPRASVILSADQAAAIVSPMFHSPGPTAAVSLDNIVDGRRKRTPSSTGISPGGTKLPGGKRKQGKNLDPNLQSTATDTTEDSFSEALAKQTPMFKKVSGKSPARSSPQSRKAKSTGSTSSGRTKRKGTPLAKQDKSSETSETEMTTPFSHISQPRRLVSCYDEESQSKTSSHSVTTEPQFPALSCERSDLVTQYGPIPSAGSTLFHNLGFILSCADRTLSTKKDSIKPLQADFSSTEDSSATDDLSSEDICSVPFNKKYLKEQLEAGGGIILENFQDTQKTSAKEVFLLSDTYLRTIKYIQCLSAAIPCISHVWVIDCCRVNELLPSKSYLHPAGYSIVINSLVEWHSKSTVLKGLHVLIVSKNEDFVNTWAPVLLAARAEMVRRLPRQEHSSESGVVEKKTAQRSGSYSVDIVLSDPSCPQDVLKRAQQLSIPVLSSEWIIQCLINGQRLPFNAHSKFKYDYTD
ncbi:uncharacterized protein LOC143236114 [Tachypleus tridentatus]|uniref:uncharacterized protein LOC143236114 n=1 Tax=Tachypleus tridentatus TaxID=6853 RepID=UPI003FCFF6B4